MIESNIVLCGRRLFGAFLFSIQVIQRFKQSLYFIFKDQNRYLQSHTELAQGRLTKKNVHNFILTFFENCILRTTTTYLTDYTSIVQIAS